MMPEISLNILDLAQNSITAGSLVTEIRIDIRTGADTLEVVIGDNGRGMAPDVVQRVVDPFFTTRTTRSVGLGLPFWKMAAEITGGSFRLDSEPGVGTRVTAVFGLSHIDRMPVGDIASTMIALIGSNPDLDFIFSYAVDDNGFIMDTREMRQTLDGVSLYEPAVLSFITDYINENIDALGPRR